MGLYLTAEELDQLSQELVQLMLERFGERRIRTEARRRAPSASSC